MLLICFVALILAFALLFKSASFFVDGAVGVARALNVSKMLVGVVLVGMATTAPELFVSAVAAFRGKPEFALGNAIGSVICDDGIALALAAILAPTAILVNCRLLKVAGIFLLGIDFLAYGLARNGTIGRLEGIVFVLILALYYAFILRRKDLWSSFEPRAGQEKIRTKSEAERAPSPLRSRLRPSLVRFCIGLAGVVFGSHIVVWAAERIAVHFGVPEIVIGLTVLAVGTSLPEISTCIMAALKGEGEIAVGNIIGADILNILWITAVASIIRPITVDLDIINFAFPFMILIVTVMLAAMRIGCRIWRIEGVVLFLLYILYLYLTIKLFV